MDFQNQPPVPKHFHEGTYRLRAPEETLAQFGRFMPVMGITRLANVTGLDKIGLPVVMAVRPNARSVSVSQGKGLTLAAAKASGLMEAIEGYHAETILLPLKFASAEELRYTHDLADIDGLPRVRGSLYTPYFRLLWAEGVNLFTGDRLWVPYELTHTDYTVPPPPGSGCFPPTSNGLASGNALIEAVVHGLQEVIERDAASLWALRPASEQAARRIDLSTVDHPAPRAALERCAAAGVGAAVWDMTSDVGIPAFLCVLVDQEDNPFRRLYATSGMGCHTSRGVALLRAVTEAAQGRLTVISGARDDVTRRDYSRFRAPEVLARARADLAMPTPRRFTDCPTWELPTFNDDLALLLERLAAVGIEQVIALDLTRPEFGIPVARVIVPGLEGINEIEDYLPGARARALMARREAEL